MREPFVFNEKGFLLLEHLIAIVIMGILSITFLALMQVVASHRADQTALTMHEVNTLAIRLQNEIRTANDLTASTNQLMAQFEDGNTVSFQIQNNRLTRQVNGRGGEILIYNISELNVYLFNEHSVRITLKSLDGNRFQFYLQALTVEISFSEAEGEEEEKEEEENGEEKDKEEQPENQEKDEDQEVDSALDKE